MKTQKSLKSYFRCERFLLNFASILYVSSKLFTPIKSSPPTALKFVGLCEEMVFRRRVFGYFAQKRNLKLTGRVNSYFQILKTKVQKYRNMMQLCLNEFLLHCDFFSGSFLKKGKNWYRFFYLARYPPGTFCL